MSAQRIENGRVRSRGPLSLALARVPEGVDPKSSEPGEEPAEVIWMRVGQDSRKHALAAASPKLGRKDPHSDVDGTSDESAAVDNHRLAVRQVHDCGIALSDIEKRDAELSFGGSGAHGDHFEAQQNRKRRERFRHRSRRSRAHDASASAMTTSCHDVGWGI